MSTMPGWTLAATALTSMSGALPWEGAGRKGRGLNRPPGRAGSLLGRGAGASLASGREKLMSQRSTIAQVAVAIATTRATTSAAVSRFGPWGAGGGGGGDATTRRSNSGTYHRDGVLHSGWPAGVAESSPTLSVPGGTPGLPAGRSSSIPNMIPVLRLHL